jgi:hypothetical protein
MRKKIQNLSLGYMTKTPPPKSEYFFQQHWESEYFFFKKQKITILTDNAPLIIILKPYYYALTENSDKKLISMYCYNILVCSKKKLHWMLVTCNIMFVGIP